MTLIYHEPCCEIHQGHVLEVLAGMPAESVDCCITSPPYWSLRKYAGEQVVEWSDGSNAALGLEPTPDCGRPFMRLRDNLTEKERSFVLQRLKEEGLL